MSAKSTHFESMIPELNVMRDVVAAAAHNDADKLSYRAHLRQAKSLRTMYGQITSWFNVAQELKVSTGEINDNAVELRYAERLALWLRGHLRQTSDAIEGGETDVLHHQPNLSKEELAIMRLFALRHREMIAEYCERHSAILEARAAELCNLSALSQ